MNIPTEMINDHKQTLVHVRIYLKMSKENAHHFSEIFGF